MGLPRIFLSDMPGENPLGFLTGKLFLSNPEPPNLSAKHIIAT